MLEIYGKYNIAHCFTDILDPGAYSQILSLCNEEAFKDSKIRIMPDVHAGSGCTVGTTVTIKDKVIPGMVGVDIGCGMETIKIKEKDIDFDKLDTLIRELIPSGAEIRTTPHSLYSSIDLEELRCQKHISWVRASRSIGTLGGGNHFIELDRDEAGDVYLVIHSGSRHLGNEVAQYYQEEGYKRLCGTSDSQIKELIARMKAAGEAKKIEKTIKELKARPTTFSREMAYVEGELFDDYIHDMKIVQRFATLNRQAMARTIIRGMCFTEVERFTTVHNYIDTDNMILRKGAISAQKGEKILIPINMRDGSLICIGKGNEEWNCSAPHGAGRLMSRSKAHHQLTMEEYQEAMKGIYSTCVVPKTLDESPMAYKSMDTIVEQITPTAEIVSVIKPIYNFKASE